MGGAGNNFYQLNLHKKYGEDFFISEVFYNQKLQSILGHTIKTIIKFTRKKMQLLHFFQYIYLFF